MAQFVTHIQPTLVEAAQGHVPHHHSHQIGMQHQSHLPHSGHNMPSPPTIHHHHHHHHQQQQKKEKQIRLDRQERQDYYHHQQHNIHVRHAYEHYTGGHHYPPQSVSFIWNCQCGVCFLFKNPLKSDIDSNGVCRFT